MVLGPAMGLGLRMADLGQLKVRERLYVGKVCGDLKLRSISKTCAHRDLPHFPNIQALTHTPSRHVPTQPKFLEGQRYAGRTDNGQQLLENSSYSLCNLASPFTADFLNLSGLSIRDIEFSNAYERYLRRL